MLSDYKKPETYFDLVGLSKDDPKWEKKVRVHAVIRENLAPGMSYNDFAMWISEPIMRFGFDQVSRQNINDWLRCKRVPYKNHFLMTKMAIELLELRGQIEKGEYADLIIFCDKMLSALEEDTEEEV